MPVRIGKDDVVGGGHIGLFARDVFRGLAEAVLGVEEGFARKNGREADFIEVAQFHFEALGHEVGHGRVHKVPFDRFVTRIAHDEENLLLVGFREAVGFHGLTVRGGNDRGQRDGVDVFGHRRRDRSLGRGARDGVGGVGAGGEKAADEKEREVAHDDFLRKVWKTHPATANVEGALAAPSLMRRGEGGRAAR